MRLPAAECPNDDVPLYTGRFRVGHSTDEGTPRGYRLSPNQLLRIRPRGQTMQNRPRRSVTGNLNWNWGDGTSGNPSGFMSFTSPVKELGVLSGDLMFTVEPGEFSPFYTFFARRSSSPRFDRTEFAPTAYFLEEWERARGTMACGKQIIIQPSVGILLGIDDMFPWFPPKSDPPDVGDSCVYSHHQRGCASVDGA